MIFFEDYLRLIDYIKTQIRYSTETLINIFTRYKDQGNVGSMIQLFLSEVNKSFAFQKSWDKSLKSIAEEVALETEDIQLFQDFGYGLGISDVEGQINHCELYKSLIESKLIEAREVKKKKSKLFLTLGFSLGAMLVLILI